MASAVLCLLVTLSLILAATAINGNRRYSNATIEANRRAHATYERCLEQRDRHRRAFGDRQHASAVRVERGASLKLDCFDW